MLTFWHVRCSCVFEDDKEQGVVYQKSQWTELEGVIVVAEQDRHGKVLEIALETGAFEMVLFTGRGKSNELIPFLGYKVRIEGTVEGKDYYGRTLFTVEQVLSCESMPVIKPH